MKILSVIRKSIREQLRSFWLLFLAVTMVPFFVFVYYLISESYKPKYRVVVYNQDLGTVIGFGGYVNFGDELIKLLGSLESDTLSTGLIVQETGSREAAEKKLKNRSADLLVVLPADFSVRLMCNAGSSSVAPPEIEFAGDLTNLSYLIASIWVDDFLYRFTETSTSRQKPFRFRETSLGVSGDRTEFELYIPGLIILSIIMLMFTASIALVAEAEKQTLQRLRLSRLSTLEYLTGVSIVQVLVGLLAVLFTLATALGLGFRLEGSLLLFFLIILLTCISLICFSLIVAAFTKTVNAVLIVGNFPLFIFMFFTGAAFPIHAREWFSIGDYGFTVTSILSPTHAVSAMNKVLILQQGFTDIIPEIACLLLLSLVYFVAGAYSFRRRHMKIFSNPG